MVIMSPMNQAALLLFLSTYGVSAVVLRNMLGYRGYSVTLVCNNSGANTTQISWTKGKYLFAYSIPLNKTYSNFSSDRVKIDISSPSQLIIINAQDDDEGLYSCNVAHSEGLSTINWNLTVSESPAKEVRSLWYSPKMVIPVTGVLLCCIIAALCLCRKLRRKTPNPNPAQSPNMQNSEEQIGAERNSQYMERLNSIYNT
ncbi:uncharacterized protein LOC117819934 isoform X2 [Notolabrus celidotus]|uniref:uncharacterized protein LOC117819934 isoform X2 n=1 Tax=Notolabrus celidotus TaxID=1203425 RepID=UPI0014905FF5|nr:uncharacterized protein LOC117819934 isoform X2 [Notolabrus celidotus]XP_034549366.1 uncharacterized protein LOC117819934 isoform X2 [Notolabrus celidotus]